MLPSKLSPTFIVSWAQLERHIKLFHEGRLSLKNFSYFEESYLSDNFDDNVSSTMAEHHYELVVNELHVLAKEILLLAGDRDAKEMDSQSLIIRLATREILPRDLAQKLNYQRKQKNDLQLQHSDIDIQKVWNEMNSFEKSLPLIVKSLHSWLASKGYNLKELKTDFSELQLE